MKIKEMKKMMIMDSMREEEMRKVSMLMKKNYVIN